MAEYAKRSEVTIETMVRVARLTPDHGGRTRTRRVELLSDGAIQNQAPSSLTSLTLTHITTIGYCFTTPISHTID